MNFLASNGGAFVRKKKIKVTFKMDLILRSRDHLAVS